MKNISSFCPIFLEHPEARVSASKASGCFMGGTGKIGAVSAETCEQVKRNRKNQSPHDRHRFHNDAGFEWRRRGWAPDGCGETRSATVARVRDRNPMEIADDLGHRSWRLLPYGQPPGSDRFGQRCGVVGR
jgi:hypothetical protein